MDDIAVVGIGLRFPGDATSPKDLWKVLEKGESQWSEFPKDRLNIDGYFHPGGDRQGSISFRGGHFLKDDIATFDAPFFSVSADDATAIDPQQRMLLEASYEALENAGIRKEDVDSSDTAVYVGSFVKDYEQICLRDPDWQPQYAATGNGIAIMANRISYAFNFHGPSVTVDTGCSGSLVSVHLAAQSLRTGESSLALAAGAGLILTPNTIMPMTALNFLSPDGKCFTFDSRANGYGRGEGIGVVVLKRLTDALRDNDTIRAVIRGSAVNQDGRTTGITLPSKEAQIANIRSVYKTFGLDFDQTAYVECHGTGTQAGDWRETKAISETLGANRDIDKPIIVGSIKPNIGHLEGAAGVAGLIKAVLVLEHGKIPPNINFKTPNPDIDFVDWRVTVPTELTDWPMSGTRRVSVNCFGFGGTNAHIIMDEAPGYLASHRLTGNHASMDTTTSVNGLSCESSDVVPADAKQHLFCFSANEKLGLQRLVESHIPYVESEEDTPEFLQNYAYTLGCRRSILEWKFIIVASSKTELVAKMRTCDPDTFKRSSNEKQPRICFIFCGQGAQWAQMGQELMRFDIFRESLQAASAYLAKDLSSDFVLADEIFKPKSSSRISEPTICQPATTALQVAMADLLASLSITPTQVLGHSSGEIAAAYVAGTISRETAWKIAYYRGVASAQVTHEGAMMAVGMSATDASQYQNWRGDVQIACINSPRSVTLSGKPRAINAIADDLRQKDVFHRILPVKVAYHSWQMGDVSEIYTRALGHVQTYPTGTVKMFSTLTGTPVRGEDLKATYWVQNMLSCVEYATALGEMLRQDSSERPNVIVELSPRSTLKSPTLDTMAAQGKTNATPYLSVLEKRLDGLQSFLQTLGKLWYLGTPLNMKDVITCGSPKKLACLVDLPSYPWNHSKSYWHESHLGRANRFREFPRQDLIGAPTADSIPFEPRWRGFFRVSEIPWVQDHQIQKTIVYPAAGMVSMVLEGARQLAKNRKELMGYSITNMKIEKAMIIPPSDHGLEMALNIKLDADHAQDDKLLGSHEFSIYSKQLDGLWNKNAGGFLTFQHNDNDLIDSFSDLRKTRSRLEKSCSEQVNPRQLYELLETVGINYGSTFQNIARLSKDGNSCASSIRIPNTKAKMPAKFEYPHLLHPATLDSMFQTLFAIDSTPMVPSYIESLFVSSELDVGGTDTFQGHSIASRTPEGARADIAMQLSDADIWVLVNGLHFTSLAKEEIQEFLPNHRNLCTEVVWREDIDFACTNVQNDQRLALMLHKYPGFELLQVGGSAVTDGLVEQLRPDEAGVTRLSRFSIAKLEHDSAETTDTMKRFEGTWISPYVETVRLDGSEPVADYHCIMVFPDSGLDSESLAKYLKPGGFILHENHPSQAPEIQRYSTPSDHCQEIMVLCADQHIEPGRAFADELVQRGKQTGVSCNITPVSLSSSKQDVSQMVGKVIVSLLDVDPCSTAASFVYGWDGADYHFFHELQRAAKGIIWITRGANMHSTNPQASPIIALARTLMSEDPQKALVTLDMSEESSLMECQGARMVMWLFVATFRENVGLGPKDMEYAEKDGRLYIPRLQTMQDLNQRIENGNGKGICTMSRPFIVEATHLATVLDPVPLSQGLKLANSPIQLSGDAYFVEAQRSAPRHNEVEIQFERAVFTYRDLDAVYENSSVTNMGMDVFGTVTRTGSDLPSELSPGAKVWALAPGCIQNFVTVDARFVSSAHRGFAPSMYVSAYYALVHVGRIRRGRAVLIFGGASGFGLAALSICKIVGAEVFAVTLDNEPEVQRRILQDQGVASDRIFDGESSTFAASSKRAAGGKGFDIVYNPTRAQSSLCPELIRPGGCVVQYQDESVVPSKARKLPTRGTYESFDLAMLMADDPDFVGELLQKASALLDTKCTAMPAPAVVEDTGIGNVHSALKSILLRPYVGHAEVSYDGKASVKVKMPEQVSSLSSAIDPNFTYLLVGGLGGLGQSIAELLVKNGARFLVFISRSGASSQEARDFVKKLDDQGVKVGVYCVDVCDGTAVAEVIQEQMLLEMPAVRGIFQCATVIQDDVFDNMTYEDWAAVFQPKAVGSQNVVSSFDTMDLKPWVVFLASSAGVIGNRGQANYAAGNFFEDMLAKHLCQEGWNAISIDLGPVLGAGMLAKDDKILDILKASGFYGIRHQDFLKVVEYAIQCVAQPQPKPTPNRIIMGVGTGGLIKQNKPADPYWTYTALFSYLNQVDMPPPDLAVSTTDTSKNLKILLANTTSADTATEIVCNGLIHMLAKSMNMLVEEMDANKTPSAYGVDSLVAVGVRNWVFDNSGVHVSVFEVLSDKTVAELAEVIAERGEFGEK